MKLVQVLGSASPRRRWLRLGEPEGNPAGEVLPRLGEAVRLSEGVLCLGEPGTAAKCCFPTVLYIVHDGFFERAPSTKEALYDFVE